MPTRVTIPKPDSWTYRLKISLRRLIGIVIVCSLMFTYAGSYYRLSRRGMHQAQEFGLPGFLYVPFEDAAASENLTWHYTLATFYAPINWIDRAVFGAPSPWISITWRLSG
ncbi:hypothetical protein Sinac_0290 [Singulisphaera acidiphila DSM 18658]|uniref:Uncharacterized protein n=1 Tax=Singulisphaera acidiphila (strain ATCC BAA-1392 / DSM 18658 / VKM B-2454 / MOB10) TaxID=886293 RepID=L0D7D2_SINAD|nr:hypothetical protein Sinac_0290 [Singulisphaera acidiphila DSM 18658]